MKYNITKHVIEREDGSLVATLDPSVHAQDAYRYCDQLTDNGATEASLRDDIKELEEKIDALEDVAIVDQRLHKGHIQRLENEIAKLKTEIAKLKGGAE